MHVRANPAQPRSVAFSLFVMDTLSVLRWVTEMEVATQGNTRAHLLTISRVTQGRATGTRTSDCSKWSACCLRFDNWALKNPEAWTPESWLYPKIKIISNFHSSGLSGSKLIVLPSLEERKSPKPTYWAKMKTEIEGLPRDRPTRLFHHREPWLPALVPRGPSTTGDHKAGCCYSLFGWCGSPLFSQPHCGGCHGEKVEELKSF